jgi:polyisoprenoid-binding protein YceI
MKLLPKTARGWLLTGAGGVTLVAVAGFLFIYFVLFPTSSPKPFKLTAAASSVPSGTSFAGGWTIATGSIAGYRVREKLAFLPAESDAVGRTTAITGTATFTQSGRTVTVKAASFKVDVYDLKSNESLRDLHIHTIGIQSATYPNATFVLSHPVTLPAGAAGGAIVSVPVSGVFTIHGTSRAETLDVQMRLAGSQIDAVGSLTFPWGRFDMTAPSVGGFVSVEPTATMEFDLRLARG